MKTSLIIFLLFLSPILYAQKVEDSFTINIYARGSCIMCEFAINIEQSPELVKIIYAVKDSLSYKRLKGDKEYIALQNQFAAANHTQEQDTSLIYSILYQMKAVEITSYSKDSLVLNPSTNANYTQLLNKIYKASTEQLENNEANKKTIILDGTSFSIKIQSNSGSRTIYVHSPQETSHPLLTELISKTLDLYREEKQNTFLDKRKTNGY